MPSCHYAIIVIIILIHLHHHHRHDNSAQDNDCQGGGGHRGWRGLQQGGREPESGAETDQSKNLIISHRLIHMVAKCQSEHLKGWSEGTFLSVGMRISAKN